MTPIEHRPTGWNTWDFRGFNRLVDLRRGDTVLALEFAIWDETVPASAAPPDPEHRQIGRLYDQFRWEHVTRLGPHAPLGLPARLEFKAGEVSYAAEAVARRGTLHLTVTPLAESQQRVVFVLLAPVGAAPAIKSPRKGTFAGRTLELRGARWPAEYFVNIAEPYAVAEPGQPATLIVRPRIRAVPVEMPRPVYGDGALADAPAAMMSAVGWNTLYDARRRLVSTPVSRDWCHDWRGVLVFCWDTYLVAMLMSYEAPALARLNFETVSAAIDELGFVPNYYMGHGAASRDRSMPPLGAYTIWKTQRAAPDRIWLGRMYPRLCRWHEFWMRHRAGHGNGLLAWGSDNVEYEFPQIVPYNGKPQFTRQAAIYESGADNSPMYDDVAFNEQTSTLAADDIGLCSYFAQDCEALAGIAETLGRTSDAARFQREHAKMAECINELLWDDEHGIYCNRHWDGRLSSRWSPTSFLPLLAGVALPERAARLVHEHLLNPAEFWGEYVIPSIARRDPAYKDNDYWRGRIWGPLNFLVAEGLRRYRFDAEAAQLARKSLELFMRNWRADGGVYENYNSETGQGGDVWNAARLYHWGGLLAFIAMQELIDVEPAGYLRLGSIDFPDGGLQGVRLSRDVYDVRLDEGVHVRRNGRRFLDCTTRAIIRVPLPLGEGGGGGSDSPLEITATRNGQLTLHDPKAAARAGRLGGGQTIAPRVAAGKLVYCW
jgi:hypothetical protein